MKKNVLITGASGDIGAEIAKSFAEHSAEFNLYIHGRDSQKLNKLAQELSASPIRYDFVDITYDQIAEMFPKQIDILINNAGICRDNIITNINENDFDQTVAVNLKTPMFLIRHISPFMKKQKWGRIINIASLSAVKGIKGQSIYSATKAGVIGMSKVIATELAPYNITVNCIAPGLIQSAMTDKIPPHRLQKLLAEIPQQRLGQPRDIAQTCLFLSKSDSSYVTGQTIHLNGGYC